MRQRRLVLHTDDFDRALAFYRDALGLPAEAAYQGEGDARVVILDAGRATLEIADSAQVALIDRIETDGTAPSDHVRIAFEVDDTDRAAGGFVLPDERDAPA